MIFLQKNHLIMIFMNSHFEKNNQQKINNLVIFEIIFVSMKSTRKFTMLLENEKKFLN